jgi:protein-tyrosine phosphatase
MDKILQNWNNFLNEQTEPYQKKMKAGHSRKKKRVIGHGGQKAGPPYSIKPSMERSKSAPPMGEGILDFFKRKKPEEEQPKEKQPVTIPPYTDYNQIGNTNIYVGRFPMQKGSDDNRVFQPDVLEKFNKIFLVADEEVDFLKSRQANILQQYEQTEANKEGKIVATEKKIDDTANPNKEQLDYMEELALKASKTEGNVLIACSAGKNRSSAIAARAIALKQGGVKSDQDLDNIVNMIRSARGPSALAYTHRHKTGDSIDRNKPPQHDAFVNFIKNGPTSTLEETLRRVIRRLIREQHGRKRYT